MRFKHYFQIIKICRQHFTDWMLLPFIIPFSHKHLEIKKGDVIGFSLFGLKKLRYIATDNTHKEKGLGTKMMNKIKKNITHLRVHPDNHRALNFFTKHGFTKTKLVKTLFGPRIIMRKCTS